MKAINEGQPGRSLIVFFNTGCVHCRESLPTYREVALQECGLRIAIVVLDRQGEGLHDWWSQNGWDPEEVCADVLVGSPRNGISEWGVRATPTNVLVDRGVVVERHMGAVTGIPEWIERTP